MRYEYNFTIYTKSKIISAERFNQLSPLESIERHLEACIYKNVAVKNMYLSLKRLLQQNIHYLTKNVGMIELFLKLNIF